MKEIGKQYSMDDIIDPTGFLRRARLYQSRYRSEELHLDYDGFGNYLTRENGEAGYNFYKGFGIFDAVQKYRKYNRSLYSNMLRSEHIPFNFFIPLNQNKTLCKDIFNEFFGGSIKIIDRIEIEYAPKPNDEYLNDRTSFDTYIEYTMGDNSKGIIGIEVKYTEKEYKLVKSSKQANDINDRTSKYYFVSENCRMYKPEIMDLLPTDKFRQIWRNHMLGESMLITDRDKFKRFTSITLFPEGNKHFVQTCKDYIKLLSSNDFNFIGLTYEDFIDAGLKYCQDDGYKGWLEYLRTRYIIPNE